MLLNLIDFYFSSLYFLYFFLFTKYCQFSSRVKENSLLLPPSYILCINLLCFVIVYKIVIVYVNMLLFSITNVLCKTYTYTYICIHIHIHKSKHYNLNVKKQFIVWANVSTLLICCILYKSAINLCFRFPLWTLAWTTCRIYCIYIH